MIVIPVHDMIILPGVTFVLQESFYKELTNVPAEVGKEVLFLILKEEKERHETGPDDFEPIGIRGVIDSVNEENSVGIRTISRVTVTEVREAGEEEFEADFTDREDENDLSQEERTERFTALRQKLLGFVAGFQWGMIVRTYIMQWKSMGEMACMMSSRLMTEPENKYKIIAADKMSERYTLMEEAVTEFIEMSRIGLDAESETAKANEKIYREDSLKKQINFLQNQLDQMHPENITDVRRFEMAIAEAGMNETAEKEAKKVLNRMKQEGQHSQEYGMLYDYLDFVTGLCWKKASFEKIEMEKAKEILDSDHYGLKKVKDRILQQIAVMQLNKRQSGSILLFVGAPGTGKTSIGQNIARALNREYVRVSLGGVRDEADIRGHRRTYIGAMAGRIMDGIKKSGVSNPVMVLDEVDKLTKDFAGDPSSALLEVLDPEQNSTFTDHYMNVPYDLSDVLFVCTANSVDTIPEPLLNRMEVIEFPGYTASEKFQIARKHLIPKASKAAGIKSGQLRIGDDALRTIISDYTMEAGVRGLKKRLDTLCRVAAVKLVSGERKSLTVTEKRLPEFLNQKPLRHDKMLKESQPGVVTGLAWTRAGGDILFIESVLAPGKGGMTTITGQLGDVMKESVQIAVTLVKKRFPEEAKQFVSQDLHIHVPEGAVPKDGPSAGITLTTALSSLVTGKAVDPSIAMTGEVSLRGLVMPIGGLPEKLMAAVRAGIKKVLIPEDNVRDLEDVPQEVKDQLEITPVHSVEDVLKITGIVEWK